MSLPRLTLDNLRQLAAQCRAAGGGDCLVALVAWLDLPAGRAATLRQLGFDADDAESASPSDARLQHALGLPAPRASHTAMAGIEAIAWGSLFAALWQQARLRPRRAAQLTLDEAALVLGIDLDRPLRVWMSHEEAAGWQRRVVDGASRAHTGWAVGLVRWWRAIEPALRPRVQRRTRQPIATAPAHVDTESGRRFSPRPEDSRVAPFETPSWVALAAEQLATLQAIERRLAVRHRATLPGAHAM